MQRSRAWFYSLQTLTRWENTKYTACLWFLRQYETAVPVWGFRSEDELQQIIYFEEHPPQVDSQFLQVIEQEKALFFGV